MAKKKYRERELLIKVLIFALAAAAAIFGWLYYEQTRDFQIDDNGNVTAVRDIGRMCVESDGYCHIPEWGIKFKTDVKDLVYRLETNEASAGFSTLSSLTNPFCDPDPRHYPSHGSMSQLLETHTLSSNENITVGSPQDKVTTKVGEILIDGQPEPTYYEYFAPIEDCNHDENGRPLDESFGGSLFDIGERPLIEER